MKKNQKSQFNYAWNAIEFSDLNYDQLEILKIRNAEEKGKSDRLYSFLAFLAIDLIAFLLIYASHALK